MSLCSTYTSCSGSDGKKKKQTQKRKTTSKQMQNTYLNKAVTVVLDDKRSYGTDECQEEDAEANDVGQCSVRVTASN